MYNAAVCKCESRLGNERPPEGRRVPESELSLPCRVTYSSQNTEDDMGFGRGALLWLLGIPLPIILLLALFWHH